MPANIYWPSQQYVLAMVVTVDIIFEGIHIIAFVRQKLGKSGKVNLAIFLIGLFGC